MIVGDEILNRELVEQADRKNLKNSTYDLTIGEIVPVGKSAIKERHRSGKKPNTYHIEPRELVWVLSNEQFKLPNTVTGLATLRTTFTKGSVSKLYGLMV